jgi:1-acyl-sn-glycerol-3-phosphate acyltransferase
MLIQDVFGLRTYTLMSLWGWIFSFILTVLCSPIPDGVKCTVLLTVLTHYTRTLLFPLHLVVEWFRTDLKTPRPQLAARMRTCFSTYFRLHHNLHTLRRRPHLIVANYPNDRLESFAVFMLARPYAFVVKSSVERHFHMSTRVPCILTPDTEHTQAYASTKEQVEEHLAAGRHIFSYINHPSSIHPRHYERYRTGMLRIAQELDIPVTPMAIDQLETGVGGALCDQSFQVWLGEPFYVTDVAHDLHLLQQFFRKQTTRFQRYKSLVDE